MVLLVSFPILTIFFRLPSPQDHLPLTPLHTLLSPLDGISSPVKTPPSGACTYLDVTLSPGGKFWQDIDPTFTSFLYILSGNLKVGDSTSTSNARLLEDSHQKHHTLVLSGGGLKTESKENGVWLENVGKEGDEEQEVRLVLVAGQPLDQEVHQVSTGKRGEDSRRDR